MDLRIGHLNLTTPATGRPRRPAGAAQLALPAAKAEAARAAVVPATPPPDVRREVEAAGRRAEALWNARRELHFDVDDESGRVIIQVRDLDGQVIRTIPPSEALDIMSAGGSRACLSPASTGSPRTSTCPGSSTS
jgi:FlaG protein